MTEQIHKEPSELVYKIFFQNEAKADLNEIGLYYAQFGGEAVAEINLDRILNSIDGLQKMPNRCPACDFSPNIKKLTVVGLPFLVFFKIIGDAVHILRIYNAKRNQKILQDQLKNF